MGPQRAGGHGRAVTVMSAASLVVATCQPSAVHCCACLPASQRVLPSVCSRPVHRCAAAYLPRTRMRGGASCESHAARLSRAARSSVFRRCSGYPTHSGGGAVPGRCDADPTRRLRTSVRRTQPAQHRNESDTKASGGCFCHARRRHQRERELQPWQCCAVHCVGHCTPCLAPPPHAGSAKHVCATAYALRGP